MLPLTFGYNLYKGGPQRGYEVYQYLANHPSTIMHASACVATQPRGTCCYVIEFATSCQELCAMLEGLRYEATKWGLRIEINRRETQPADKKLVNYRLWLEPKEREK